MFPEDESSCVYTSFKDSILSFRFQPSAVGEERPGTQPAFSGLGLFWKIPLMPLQICVVQQNMEFHGTVMCWAGNSLEPRHGEGTGFALSVWQCGCYSRVSRGRDFIWNIHSPRDMMCSLNTNTFWNESDIPSIARIWWSTPLAPSTADYVSNNLWPQ